MTKTKRNLIIFIAVALLSGWFGVLVDMVLEQPPEQEESLGMGIWLVLPLLTAIILSIISKDFKNAGLKPRFKGNLKWYLLSLTAFPAAGAIALVFARIFGVVEFTNVDMSVILPIIAIAFGFNIIKNIFEEFAWRGFLTPKLLECKINDWWLYIISGLVWALWHVPYYLFFLPESIFEPLSVSRIGFTVIATLIMLCWTVIYVEVFRLSKTVWTCTVMHAAEDGVVMTLFAGGYYVFTNGLTTWIFDPHVGIIVAGLILAAGLVLRKIRINNQPPKI